MTIAALTLVLTAAQGPAIEWHSVSYSPDGKYILAAKNKMAGLWDAKTGKYLLTLEARDYVSTAAFAADSKSFYFGGRDKMLRKADLPQFDPKAKEPVALKFIFMETGAVGPEHKSWISKMAMNSDGKKAALAMGDAIVIVDTKTGQTLQTIEKANGFGSMHFSKGDKQLITTPITTGIAIYDLTTTPPTPVLKSPSAAHGSDGSLSPSGRYFVMGNQTGNSGVIDFEKNDMHHTVNLPKESWVDVHGWAKNEKSYFIGGNHGDVWVIGLETGKIERLFRADGRVGGIAVHPDGKRIAVAAGTVSQFDWTTGKPIKP